MDDFTQGLIFGYGSAMLGRLIDWLCKKYKTNKMIKEKGYFFEGKYKDKTFSSFEEMYQFIEKDKLNAE